MTIFSKKPKFTVAAPTIRREKQKTHAASTSSASASPATLASPALSHVSSRTSSPNPSRAPLTKRKNEVLPSSHPVVAAPPTFSAYPAGASPVLSNSPLPSSSSSPLSASAALPHSSSSPPSDSPLRSTQTAIDRKRKIPSSASASSSSSLSIRASTTRRPSPAVARDQRITFDEDSSDDDNGDDWLHAIDERKRRKRESEERPLDTSRILFLSESVSSTTPSEALSASSPSSTTFIHASSLVHRTMPKGQPILGTSLQDDDQTAVVYLQYPSAMPPERFELVWCKDAIDTVASVLTVVQLVVDHYLPAAEAEAIMDVNHGMLRRLTRSSNAKYEDAHAFRSALEEFNAHVRQCVARGVIQRHWQGRHSLPPDLTSFILNQVYDRTVAPKVELLAKYENGSDNVYGELLHPFISDILVRRLDMTSRDVFVDLGSGVGNVVLQAALEVGCESWGCEMMENACNLAEAQVREFRGRCRAWGIATGRVHLERGDFRRNERIQEVISRADVLLVNNQAFTSQLNDDLVRMFLDLKPGCRIISLKTFVHDHKSASLQVNDVAGTILEVEELTYPEGYVSWTNAGGSYCISTRR